jgi:hypothetical protein
MQPIGQNIVFGNEIYLAEHLMFTGKKASMDEYTEYEASNPD